MHYLPHDKYARLFSKSQCDLILGARQWGKKIIRFLEGNRLNS